MKAPTKRQQQVLDFIRSQLEHGRPSPPSLPRCATA